MKIAFVNALDKSYGVRPRVLSGNARADLQEINNWIQQRTGGKVTRFLRDLPIGISILMLGAAYFKGKIIHEKILTMARITWSAMGIAKEYL